MSFSHRVFQSIAELLDLPGMPDFLRAEDITATYTEITGEPVGDLTWFEVYASTQWACVFLRTGARQARFGEIEQPDEPDDLFHHRALFAAMLEKVRA